MLGSVSNLWSNWTMYFLTKRRRILRNTDHSRICVLTHSSRFALAINHLKHLPVFILHLHQIRLYSYSLEDSNTRGRLVKHSQKLVGYSGKLVGQLVISQVPRSFASVLRMSRIYCDSVQVQCECKTRKTLYYFWCYEYPTIDPEYCMGSCDCFSSLPRVSSEWMGM